MSQYVVDKDGKKTHVLLTIEEYEQLMEDVRDLAVIEERKDEETFSHEEALKIIMSED